MSAAGHMPQRYTYADLKTWPDDERWELIKGVPYCMSPAPSPRHTQCATRLYSMLDQVLQGKTCTALAAPIDVFPLAGSEDTDDEDTCVQPDVMIVCDRAKITVRGIIGAPDLVVEVLSPSSARIDTREKYEIYALAGVREYWIVDTSDRVIESLIRGEDGRWGSNRVWREGEVLAPSFLPEARIDLAALFGELVEPADAPPPRRSPPRR